MGRKMKETPTEVKNIIINHFLQGKFKNVIAETVQKPRITIYYIIKKFKSVGTVENKPRRRCPKKLTDADERWIEPEVKKDPPVNEAKLAKIAESYLNIKVTLQTIRKH
ncbi:hypothetical protein NPIL_74321 [Nephila pilipes]|uniref:Uncharacterized protein n=1 Tax=Nephila pilipes TaxID=299642 RepID=A0A8X6U2M2_NEPPI|nr:hypothetical protein NPIL_74321 [Nephila pilipes]